MKYDQTKHKLKYLFDKSNSNKAENDKLADNVPVVLLPEHLNKTQKLYTDPPVVITPLFLSMQKPTLAFPVNNDLFSAEWFSGSQAAYGHFKFIPVRGVGPDYITDFELNGEVVRVEAFYMGPLEGYWVKPNLPLVRGSTNTWRIRYYEGRWTEWSDYNTFHVAPEYPIPELIQPVYAYYNTGGLPLQSYPGGKQGYIFEGNQDWWMNIPGINARLMQKHRKVHRTRNDKLWLFSQHITDFDEYMVIPIKTTDTPPIPRVYAEPFIGIKATGSSIDIYGTGHLEFSYGRFIKCASGYKFKVKADLEPANWNVWKNKKLHSTGYIRIRFWVGTSVIYDSGYQRSSFESSEITVNATSFELVISVWTRPKGDIKRINHVEVKLTHPLEYSFGPGGTAWEWRLAT